MTGQAPKAAASSGSPVGASADQRGKRLLERGEQRRRASRGQRRRARAFDVFGQIRPQAMAQRVGGGARRRPEAAG